MFSVTDRKESSVPVENQKSAFNITRVLLGEMPTVLNNKENVGCNGNPSLYFKKVGLT